MILLFCGRGAGGCFVVPCPFHGHARLTIHLSPHSGISRFWVRRMPRLFNPWTPFPAVPSPCVVGGRCFSVL